jgi:PIN domain nuclease of toxin-antitoxin system
MELLLDTHALLWFAEGNERLSGGARQAMEATDALCVLSVASAWEIAIKVSLGKLTLDRPVGVFLPELLADLSIALLPIEMADVATVSELPFHHRDPFDRLIAAQALRRGLSIVSVDATFDAYGVSRVW